GLLLEPPGTTPGARPPAPNDPRGEGSDHAGAVYLARGGGRGRSQGRLGTGSRGNGEDRTLYRPLPSSTAFDCSARQRRESSCAPDARRRAVEVPRRRGRRRRG